MRTAIAPGVATWWAGVNNGLYDNSLPGVVNLGLFAPIPSPDIYYFTMSFCATQPFPTNTLTATDINDFFKLFPLNQIFNPLGVWGKIAAPFQRLGTRLGVLPSLRAALTWGTNVANRHLRGMGYFDRIPIPGTEIPRSDMLPIIIFPAYAMGGIPVNAFPGITSEQFRLNDGIVNTRSMDGPDAGPVNNGNFAAQFAATGPMSVKGIYWHLGTNATMDHADQIGVFTKAATVIFTSIIL
jgi:hypothetical protein